MPKYKKEHLIAIAHALACQDYKGLANTVYWWTTEGYYKSNFRIMRRPLKEMPMYVSDENSAVRIVAATRLQIGR